MTDEGYIKFNCNWTKGPLPVVENAELISELLKVRDLVFEMGLIGYDEKEKVGFGNISIRLLEKEFIISGTQTGHLKNLQSSDLAWVQSFSFDENSVNCGGPAKASSESMTHAAIYMSVPEIKAVIHVHSNKIWNTYLNKIATTAPEIPYGTPEMAKAVQELFMKNQFFGKNAFVMAGHQDGVVCFGNSLKEALLCLKNLVNGEFVI